MDIFDENFDENWLKARRAILRSPLDRIGYGGYLQLASRWDGFVDVIKEVVDRSRLESSRN